MKRFTLITISLWSTVALAEGVTVKPLLNEKPAIMAAPAKPIGQAAKAAGVPKETAAPVVEKTDVGATITAMEIESDTANTAVTVKLSHEASWPNLDVEDHGTFLQVKFPSTTVTKSGEFIDGKGPYVAKLAVFQVADGEAAVRIFLKRDANLVKTATKVDVLGSRVMVFIDHGLLEKIGITEHLAKATVPPREGPAEASAPDPAPTKPESFANLTGIPAAPKQKHDVLNEKLEVAAMFSGFMLMGLLAVLGLKRFMKKRSRGSIAEDTPAIKTLANYPISPKQKLTLIQIGDEKILLAVNQNSVSFLTNLAARNSYAAQANLPLQQALPREALPREVLAATRRSAEPSFETLPERSKPDAQARSSVKSQFGNKLLAEKEPASHLRLKEQAPAKAPAKPASRIQVAIDDSGITDLNSGKTTVKRAAASASPAKQNQSIEDVTALIRRKLRDLPAKN